MCVWLGVGVDLLSLKNDVVTDARCRYNQCQSYCQQTVALVLYTETRTKN